MREKFPFYPSSSPWSEGKKKTQREAHPLFSSSFPPTSLRNKKKMTNRPDSAASLDAAGFPGSPLQDVSTCVREVRGIKLFEKPWPEAFDYQKRRRERAGRRPPSPLCFEGKKAGGKRSRLRSQPSLEGTTLRFLPTMSELACLWSDLVGKGRECVRE